MKIKAMLTMLTVLMLGCAGPSSTVQSQAKAHSEDAIVSQLAVGLTWAEVKTRLGKPDADFGDGEWVPAYNIQNAKGHSFGWVVVYFDGDNAGGDLNKYKVKSWEVTKFKFSKGKKDPLTRS